MHAFTACRHQSWTEDRRLCTTTVVLLGNWNELLHGKYLPPFNFVVENSLEHIANINLLWHGAQAVSHAFCVVFGLCTMLRAFLTG